MKKCCNVNWPILIITFFSTSNIMKNSCDLPSYIHYVIFGPYQEKSIFFMLPHGIQGERRELGKVSESLDYTEGCLGLVTVPSTVCFKLHLYSKISENFPHLLTFLSLSLSQYIQISPESKPCVEKELWNPLEVSTRQLEGMRSSILESTGHFLD